MRRGSALFSGLIIRRSGASRISIGNSPSSHIAKIGPPGWQGTTLRMSPRRRDCSSPHGVNGGFDGHGVLDHGGGPAGSSNVPTATHTPVSPSCEAFDDTTGLSAEEEQPATTTRLATNETARTSIIGGEILAPRGQTVPRAMFRSMAVTEAAADDIPQSAPVVDCAAYVAGQRAANLTIDQLRSAVSQPLQFVWLGLYDPDHALLRRVQAQLGLHDLAIEDAVHAHQRPKLELYENSLFVVLRTAQRVPGSQRVEFGETHLFVGENYIVTVRHGSLRRSE